MDWLQTQKLTPDSPGAYDYFGNAVAISEETALIGAYGKNGPTWPEGGGNDGIVYVFLKSWGGWNEIQKLIPQDAEPGDHFGSAVAIDNDYAIIGAPGVDGAEGYMTGAAYIFERENGIWIEKQKLIPPPPPEGATLVPDAQFGFSVSISDKYAIVGCPGKGYAYIYERHFHINGYTWALQNSWILLGNAADQFGYSVSISSAPALRVIVGARWDDALEGKVYIYEYSDEGAPWMGHIYPLYASDKDIAGEARFGHSVVIKGNYAVVGAPEARNSDDTGNQETGHVYIFKRTEELWEEVKIFDKAGVNRDLSGVELFGYNALGSGDKFGSSVDIKDNIVVAGCKEDYVFQPNTNPQEGADGGSIYILEQIASDIWKAKRILRASDAKDDNNLGRSVSIGEHGIIGGAWRAENGALIRAGAAYIFEYIYAPKSKKLPVKLLRPKKKRYGAPIMQNIMTRSWSGIKSQTNYSSNSGYMLKLKAKRA